MKRAARTLGWIGLSCLAAAIGCEDDQALWGDAMSVDEVAAASGTIGYELLTALAARVRVEET
jgi:alanine racemase